MLACFAVMLTVIPSLTTNTQEVLSPVQELVVTLLSLYQEIIKHGISTEVEGRNKVPIGF